MNEKAKKKRWTIFYPPFEPFEPFEPIEPLKPAEFFDDVSFVRKRSSPVIQLTGETHDNCSLADLKNFLNSSEDSENLFVQASVSFDHESVDPLQLIIAEKVIKKVKNPNYEMQLKHYEKQQKKYEEVFAQHKLDLIEWEQWKKEQLEKQEKNEISRAKAVLKKHGLL